MFINGNNNWVSYKIFLYELLNELKKYDKSLKKFCLYYDNS